MVFNKCDLEGTGTFSIASVTSLPQHTPVPTPPETKCSGESRVKRPLGRAKRREEGEEGMDEGRGGGGPDNKESRRQPGKAWGCVLEK